MEREILKWPTRIGFNFNVITDVGPELLHEYDAGGERSWYAAVHGWVNYVITVNETMELEQFPFDTQFSKVCMWAEGFEFIPWTTGDGCPSSDARSRSMVTLPQFLLPIEVQ